MVDMTTSEGVTTHGKQSLLNTAKLRLRATFNAALGRGIIANVDFNGPVTLPLAGNRGLHVINCTFPIEGDDFKVQYGEGVIPPQWDAADGGG